MLSFVKSQPQNPLLIKDPFYKKSQTPELAPSLVARRAFTDRACKWYFVEKLNDEFEDVEGIQDSTAASAPPDRLRVEGGKPCTQAGFWFTPAKLDSRRYFKQNEIMPAFGSDYGSTIWQWDPNQEIPKL
jgi:hypothetical protein